MLRECFKEHRQATNNPNPSNAATAVRTHFNLLGHSVSDMRLIPLELQPNNNGSRRKERKAYLTERVRVKLCHQAALTDEMNVSHESFLFFLTSSPTCILSTVIDVMPCTLVNH